MAAVAHGHQVQRRMIALRAVDVVDLENSSDRQADHAPPIATTNCVAQLLGEPRSVCRLPVPVLVAPVASPANRHSVRHASAVPAAMNLRPARGRERTEADRTLPHPPRNPVRFHASLGTEAPQQQLAPTANDGRSTMRARLGVLRPARVGSPRHCQAVAAMGAVETFLLAPGRVRWRSVEWCSAMVACVGCHLAILTGCLPERNRGPQRRPDDPRCSVAERPRPSRFPALAGHSRVRICGCSASARQTPARARAVSPRQCSEWTTVPHPSSPRSLRQGRSPVRDVLLCLPRQPRSRSANHSPWCRT